MQLNQLYLNVQYDMFQRLNTYLLKYLNTLFYLDVYRFVTLNLSYILVVRTVMYLFYHWTNVWSMCYIMINLISDVPTLIIYSHKPLSYKCWKAYLVQQNGYWQCLFFGKCVIDLDSYITLLLKWDHIKIQSGTSYIIAFKIEQFTVITSKQCSTFLDSVQFQTWRLV